MAGTAITSASSGSGIRPPDPGSFVAYADGRTAAASGYLVKLGELASNMVAPTIDPTFPEPVAAPVLTLSAPPDMDQIVWAAPAIPAAFTETVTIEDILPAPFESEPPDMVFGSVPTFHEVAPDAPGVDLQFEMPELDLALPTAPQLLGVNVTTFGGLNLPASLELDIPELQLEAPSIREYVPQRDYTSALLTSLQDRLQLALAGGTGLSADVENAIWDRGREREARSARTALDELDRMEEMGFALPPGVYLDARIKIATETDAANRGHSREVMIKAAELEQENVKNALTIAVQLEGQLMSWTNNVEQRVFESCRYATEAGVAIYNARVQAYAAFLETFKARVAVYEATIRGELAKVEAYKAMIDAERAKADTNRALVESYKVQVDASLSAVEIFKARIAGIQVKADIEKTKIEIFGEQVRAFSAKVQAYTAGVEGFRATVSAEATKQDAFKSQVQAYAARVDAAARVIGARIEGHKAKIDAKQLEYEGFKALITAETARVQAISETNKSRSETYRAEVQGVASYNDVLTKQWQAAIEQSGRLAEIGVSAAKANAELYVTSRTMAVEAAKVGAQVSAQLGAAALNAINWSTSWSDSFSMGISQSTSESSSSSSSVSTSTNYNYNV